MAKSKKTTQRTRKHKSEPEQILRGATGTDSSKPIPPGATRQAFDRPEDPEHEPGSGAGNLHAVGEAGGGNLVTGLVENDDEDTPTGRHPEDEHDEPAYGGMSGGAVGGTPAGGRAEGGRVHGGIDPESVHRGDSTVGEITSAPRRRKAMNGHRRSA